MINKQLEQYKQEAIEIQNKKFNNFHDLEKECCAFINKGVKLRSAILNNPKICDKNSLKVLTNQSSNLSLLDEKFQCLSAVIYMKKFLMEQYEIYVIQLLQEKKYNEAIAIYNQMFNFTNNSIYLWNISDMYEKLKDYYNQLFYIKQAIMVERQKRGLI